MTASVQQLSERLRAEIGDTARAFTDSFTGDGTTVRFQLTTYPVQGYTLVIKVNGVDKSSFVTVEEGTGIITFVSTQVPANASIISVVGQSYRYFTDSEISYYINTAFFQHAGHTTDPNGSRVGQVSLLPPIDEYPLVLLASTMALYTLATDSAFDIDIISPDGVSIPRSERFRQLNEMVEIRKNQYKELCTMLGVGLYRIEVASLRRISRRTNRYVPIYRPQEIDDHSLPDRVTLPMPDYGDITPPTPVLTRDISMYSGDDFTMRYQFGFDLTTFTPKGQIRLYTQGDFAQVGPVLLADFTITKYSVNSNSVLDGLIISLPATTTEDLPKTCYYDIQMTGANGKVKTYATGKVFTQKQVTI
jgi:hypothetical protein